VDVLESQFDGDMRDFSRWKVGIGEELPNALSDLMASDVSAGHATDLGNVDEPDLPPALRAEWRELLAAGLVDRVGLGVVDERARRFFPEERLVADLLAMEGKVVVAQEEDHTRPGIRQWDADVDGVPAEFKALEPGATNATVKSAVKDAMGQARHVIVDCRLSGISEAEARRGVARVLGTPERNTPRLHTHRWRGVRL
jgi:hypothetical protein